MILTLLFGASLFALALNSVLLVLAYQVYRFILRPYLQLRFYKKQGLQVHFFPVFGYLKLATTDLINHGDLFYSWKQKNYQNPKPRAFASNFSDRPLVALKDPELIREFYNVQEKNYIKAPPAIDIPKLILNNATILAEGETWKQHRKLSNSVYSYEVLRSFIPEIVKIVDERLEVLKQKNQINFLVEVQHILTEVTGRIFLGIELHKLEFKGQTVSSFVAEIIDRAGLESLEPFTLIFTTKVAKLGIHPRQKKLVKDIEDLRTFLYGAATARLGEILAENEKTGGSDKVPLLLQVIYEQMQKFPTGEITAVDLVDEFANFAMGAMDTTSHMLTFASHYHLNNPNAGTLLGEVNKVFGDASTVDLDKLNGMDYMSAVIKETNRMAAPLPILLPRVALKDHDLGGLKIKAGTVVCLGAVMNSSDPEYHDQPEKFSPERWLDENSRTRKSVAKSSYVHIPFSSGPRVCSGQQFAVNFGRIVLGLFLKKFDYELADKNYKLKYSAKFFTEPLEPLVYTLKAKSN